MPIRIQTRFHQLICPQCNSVLAQNRPFGPPQVRCRNCETIVKTNLPYWYDTFPIAGWRRFLMVLEELLNPSALGVPGITGYFIHLLVIYPLIFGFTLSLGLLYYPLFRLVRMIKEMKAYKRTGEPPAWGKKALVN